VSNEQLRALAKRVPARYIKQKPGGFKASYVSHSEIQQMLLAKLGPVDQRVIDFIRSPEGVVEGVLLEMVFPIDGRLVTVQEIGECERPGTNNGVNAKNAVSDGIKRCAMRVGLGLELWSQENYVLDKALAPKIDDDEGDGE